MVQQSGGTLYSIESGERITPEFEAGLQGSVERHPAFRAADRAKVESMHNLPPEKFPDPTVSPADSQFRLAPPTRTLESED